MSVTFIHLTDARQQFAASGSFLDLRLVMEDHHIVLLQNLTASQELVLAHTYIASRSGGLSAHRSCAFMLSRVLASSRCPQGLLLLPYTQWLLKTQASSFCRNQNQRFISHDNSHFAGKHPSEDNNKCILASISLQFSD